MLTEKDLLTWYSNNGTSEETQAVIARIRSSDPARRVGGGRRNVVGRYPSRKMRATIQFESHRVELAAIYELEHDRDVSEYYDQPPTFKLDYLGAAGRRLGVLHTADFFVIRRNHAGWEECKTQEDLNRLAQHNENRYQSADGGGWRCPPGEAYAVPLGLYYRVRSSGDINWVFQRNIQFLDDYLHGDVTVISSVREAVIARVGVSPGSSLQELFDTTAGIATRDDIYSLIAAGEIHADIHSESLTEPDRILLFRSEAEASSGLNEASKPAHVAVRVEQQTAAEVRLRKANEHELAIANERLREQSQLRLHRPARIKQVGTHERHEGKKAVVFAAMRRAGEEQQRLEAVGILKLSDQTMGEGHAGLLVHIEVVCFIHNNKVPGFCLEHPIMTTILIVAQGVKRSHDIRVELPEIHFSGIERGVVLSRPNIEHREQSLLPLVDE